MKKRLKILILILVVLAAIFVYYIYSSDKQPAPEDSNLAVVTSNGSREKSDERTEKILTMLKLVESVELDTSFFENPLFNSLIDNSVELNPEPVGRNNPFAPF
ncbi:hypothetical protein KKD04_02650 [Patescibacteria group bacterium]|nr:hypothetical protein [Patescibacteria group bacterium]